MRLLLQISLDILSKSVPSNSDSDDNVGPQVLDNVSLADSWPNYGPTEKTSQLWK